MFRRHHAITRSDGTKAPNHAPVERSLGTMRASPADTQLELRRRLSSAVRLWHEATDAPLPRLDPDEPSKQVAALEGRLVEELLSRMDSEHAADREFQLAELVEGRPVHDPLRRRVDAVLGRSGA
jgi:hypothetical protein